jgi:hypothetical protein
MSSEARAILAFLLLQILPPEASDPAARAPFPELCTAAARAKRGSIERA